MKTLIKHYFGLSSCLLYLFIIMISYGLILFGWDYFRYQEARTTETGAVISEEVVYLFSPLQCAVFLIPVLFISLFLIENKISSVELVTEPRLDNMSYLIKNIITHLINCTLFSFFTVTTAFASAKAIGNNIPVIFAIESFISKLLYFLILSLILEIMKIFRIKLIFACSIVYALTILEYILTFSYGLFQGILFPYAVYKINQLRSYIFLVIWLVGTLILYIICRRRIQEFINENKA